MPIGSHGKPVDEPASAISRDLAPIHLLPNRRRHLSEQERRRDELVAFESTERATRETHLDDDVRVDDDPHSINVPHATVGRPRPRPASGRPRRSVAIPAGSVGDPTTRPRYASRSRSSRTCCVPILRAGQLALANPSPDGLGLRPARRAASGTVSIVVVYYNIADDRRRHRRTLSSVGTATTSRRTADGARGHGDPR